MPPQKWGFVSMPHPDFRVEDIKASKSASDDDNFPITLEFGSQSRVYMNAELAHKIIDELNKAIRMSYE